jgi:hypothetical protein
MEKMIKKMVKVSTHMITMPVKKLVYGKMEKNTVKLTTTWPDGGKYVGEWKDDKRNGQATLIYPDGEIHVSQWEDDKKIGKGSTTFPDGTVYPGSNNDLNFEYSESLSNKNLKNEQIHKICSEYENKNTNNMRLRYDFEWREDKINDLKRNISNHCTNAKVRTEFKKKVNTI